MCRHSLALIINTSLPRSRAATLPPYVSPLMGNVGPPGAHTVHAPGLRTMPGGSSSSGMFAPLGQLSALTALNRLTMLGAGGGGGAAPRPEDDPDSWPSMAETTSEPTRREAVAARTRRTALRARDLMVRVPLLCARDLMVHVPLLFKC